MQFNALNATFGKFEQCSLTFSEGLNIVEAPNESGKSTLAAFLRSMLYGLKSSERGALADKNHFLPWCGKPMCGSLDLSTVLGDITLRRDTVRANSPMGHFSAVYTGTGTEVSHLTGSDCGETLLGIPREVYERSAFIRQSGLSIDSDAELERRIAALITTGEEGSSYSETANKLKKQLNARKHNKTGRIPALESEIAEFADSLRELSQLSAERTEAQDALSALQSEKEFLQRDLAAHELYDKQASYLARKAAEREADEADAKCELLYRMMREANTPEREVIEDCRSKLRSLDELEVQRKEADGKCRTAQSALNRFDAGALAKNSLLPAAMLAASASCVLSCIIAILLWKDTIGSVCFGAAAIAFSLIYLISARKQKSKKAALTQQRAKLENTLREFEAAVHALEVAYNAQSSAVLAALKAEDIAHAKAYIDENLSRYEMLSSLQQAAQRAQLRLELLPNAVTSPAAEPIEKPARSREELQISLNELEHRIENARRTIDFTDGRIRAIGEREALEASLSVKHESLDHLNLEYDALALAMEALEHANTSLQTRFSPALSKRAAELFSVLTDGKYDTVLLDRAFRAQAEEVGCPIPHDAALLSQGAADQLYLAVRLAICELVLPEDKNIPLVLDDALTNFDDNRCAKALELLLEESRKRQIILLTCQHRESAYLANRSGVHVLSL